MTSMPASRSARAMILAPRSWPSRPGLATTTRILRAVAGRCSRVCVSAAIVRVALGACDLEDHRVALTAAGADRRDAEAAATPPQLVDQRAEDACARGTDRVAQRDRAAVDVHLGLVDAEHPHRVDRDRGEGLVDLEDVDVVDRQSGLLERLLRGGRGRAGEV